MQFYDCEFINNSANYGGAIYSNRGVSVERCSFTDNSASTQGGAIDSEIAFSGSTSYTPQYTLNIKSSNFTNNKVLNLNSNGGAIYYYSTVSYSKYIIQDSNFINNYAINGGALYVGSTNSQTNTLSNVSFIDNIANNEGGAIYILSGGHDIGTSNFINNSARYGGAISVNTPTRDVQITSSIFNDNTAITSGGAIFYR